jgi:hypothetical protein
MWPREPERRPHPEMMRIPYERRGYSEMGRSPYEGRPAPPAVPFERRATYDTRAATEMYHRRSPPQPAYGGAMGGG